MDIELMKMIVKLEERIEALEKRLNEKTTTETTTKEKGWQIKLENMNPTKFPSPNFTFDTGIPKSVSRDKITVRVDYNELVMSYDGNETVVFNIDPTLRRNTYGSLYSADNVYRAYVN
jgi:hypothetical protein